MKNQAFFSQKDKSTKFKMSSAAIFVGALRVKIVSTLLLVRDDKISVILTDSLYDIC